MSNKENQSLSSMEQNDKQQLLLFFDLLIEWNTKAKTQKENTKEED